MEWALPVPKPAQAKKPILCIAGATDIYTPMLHCEPLIRAVRAVSGTLLQTVCYSTGHFFADYRPPAAETLTPCLKRHPSV